MFAVFKFVQSFYKKKYLETIKIILKKGKRHNLTSLKDY